MSTTFIHGRWGYIHHGCRCDLCVSANNDYAREWRNANHARYSGEHPEGKPYNNATFRNHGCRCPRCTEAKRAYAREYYARKKAEGDE